MNGHDWEAVGGWWRCRRCGCTTQHSDPSPDLSIPLYEPPPPGKSIILHASMHYGLSCDEASVFMVLLS